MLGDACGDCQIVVGTDCLPCPNNADFPECVGCIVKTDVARDVLVPVVIGVLTTLAAAFIVHKLTE